MIKLDLKDKKIIYELDKNCRQSNSQIAKKVGLSKQVVNYRIKQLVQEGIIKKFITLLNVPQFGYLSYKVMLQLQNTNPAKERELIKTIQSNPSVHWLVSCFGRWDIIFAISAKTVIEFNKKLNEMLKPVETNIKEKETLLITDMHQFSRSYLLEKQEKTWTYFGGESKETKIDETDIKIIKILSNNARIEFVGLAKQLNTTIDIVRYRIKKLVKEKIIQNFRVDLNRELLGYQYWNILIKTQELTEEKEKKFISYLKQKQNIIFTSKYMGEYDFGIELEVKNIEELQKILMEIRHLFSEIMKTYETILFIKEHKIHYLPK